MISLHEDMESWFLEADHRGGAENVVSQML
jgi:hypothetical protein